VRFNESVGNANFVKQFIKEDPTQVNDSFTSRTSKHPSPSSSSSSSSLSGAPLRVGRESLQTHTYTQSHGRKRRLGKPSHQELQKQGARCGGKSTGYFGLRAFPPSSFSFSWVSVVLVLWCQVGAGVCGPSKSIMRSGRGLHRGLFKHSFPFNIHEIIAAILGLKLL